MRIAVLASALTAALAVHAHGGESETMRFAIFRGYTAAIEASCPAYFVYASATTGGHLSPQDRAVAMAEAAGWRDAMANNVNTLGCDAAARDALAFTDLSFGQVWEYKK